MTDWDHTMTLSLRSLFLCTRAFGPVMQAQGHGRIVCLSSSARNGTVWNAFHVGASAYSTAKAGVTGFVRALAIELAGHGITINAVAPGPIDTELAGPYLRKMHKDGLEYCPIRMTPLLRLDTPREVGTPCSISPPTRQAMAPAPPPTLPAADKRLLSTL